MADSVERLTAALAAEVAQRQAVERELRQTAAELARSQRELEQFASIASHELRAPLQKVRAFADLLEQEHRTQLDDEGRDFLRRMTRAVTRMEGLVGDLVTLARARAAEPRFARIDLAAVARAVVADLDALLNDVGGRVDIGASLPAIEADQAQMHQLLHQLVANAVKFRRDGRALVVRIDGRVGVGVVADATAVGDICEIEVADNGIGFDSRYNETIFRPFERLHGPQQYEGSGIGLAVCATIAERHGGRITAVGTPGEGATFKVTLPVRHVKVNAAGAR